jgi:hypothetical protein
MPKEETKFAEEVAAVIISDVRVRLKENEALTNRELREAILESARTLISDAHFVVEPDAINALVMKVRLVWKAQRPSRR